MKISYLISVSIAENFKVYSKKTMSNFLVGNLTVFTVLRDFYLVI